MKKNSRNFFNRKFPGGPKNLVFLVFCILLVLGLTKMIEYTRTIENIPYSEFITQVEAGKVAKIGVSGSEVSGFFKDGGYFETVIAKNEKNWELFKNQGIEVSVSVPSPTLWYLFLLALILVIPFCVWLFAKQSKAMGSGGGPGNMFGFGKSKARMHLPPSIKVRFNDVAGVVEAKEELHEVVEFLKNPKKYKRLGAEITRGVLLVGEPGNGKTMLAKAVAGEANSPFFSITGSDFIEVFVGVGAARVRDMFAKARKHAPCIVFIDEIDAVGRHRGSGMGGGNDEREQTLNQLLTEMDGFETHEGGDIIVMAATNRPDVLDKALLRRFQRHVEVPFPDLKSREMILGVHAKKVTLDPYVDLHKVARGTPGFSGASLANLVNESAMHATRHNRAMIMMEDFEAARDKIILGKEVKTMMLTEPDRRIIAYHEGGHAIVRLLMPEHTDPLHKVTIIPRGRALGVTHYLPEREKYLHTKKEMMANVMAALGGRAAEELVFDDLGSGAASDFQAATDIVRRMVMNYGMSEAIGPVVYQQNSYGEKQYSDQTAQTIDLEIQSILKDAYKKTKQLLSDNRDKLDALSHELLAKETLYASEIYTLLDIEPREDFKLI